MVNENIIPIENKKPVEEVSELEGELTPEQKQKNQDHILNNLDKYIVDIHGNFFNTDNDDYIGQKSLINYEEIKEKMVEMIIKDKENWEIVMAERENYRKKGENKIMFSA